jgi:hypothetical protein
MTRGSEAHESLDDEFFEQAYDNYIAARDQLIRHQTEGLEGFELGSFQSALYTYLTCYVAFVTRLENEGGIEQAKTALEAAANLLEGNLLPASDIVLADAHAYMEIIVAESGAEIEQPYTTEDLGEVQVDATDAETLQIITGLNKVATTLTGLYPDTQTE